MKLQSIKQRYGIIGRSPLLDRALDTAVRVANTHLSILIFGESGVGKEVFSKIIHSLSSRKHNQFIAINCGAIPAGTINSELFGHEKGAFTGATSDRKGYFETVDGGTIFLDEVAEMPLDTQAFLLRILESGEFMRVGSSKVLKTDVRVVAATNADLEEQVRKGKFREDLYYRLKTVPIQIPALKERPEDIYMLFRKFSNDFAEKYKTEPIQLEDRAQLLIENYSWPGNIRELKNVAEQVSVLSEERFIAAEALIDFMPNLVKRNLPMIPEKKGSGAENFQEREILYKFLFEMKHDLSDLKKLVYGLISSNDLEVADTKNLKKVQSFAYSNSNYSIADFEDNQEESLSTNFPVKQEGSSENLKPIIIQNPSSDFDRAEVVEENLSLEEMEKELIRKALKKHKGRRKAAAMDLGISERTLYRKINQYGLEDKKEVKI